MQCSPDTSATIAVAGQLHHIYLHIQEAAVRKALLEAAYDGEDAELQRLLDKAAALGIRDAVRAGL